MNSNQIRHARWNSTVVSVLSVVLAVAVVIVVGVLIRDAFDALSSALNEAGVK